MADNTYLTGPRSMVCKISIGASLCNVKIEKRLQHSKSTLMPLIVPYMFRLFRYLLTFGH